jgi:hypothetical protein
MVKKLTLCPEYKVLFWGKSITTHHITEYHSFFHALWWLHHVMGMLVIDKD